MSRKFILLLGLIFPVLLFSENTEIYNYDFIETLIKNHKYDLAERKIDEILKGEPNSPEALMYKGVLLYYKESISLRQNHQWKAIENIYEPEFQESNLENSTISIVTAQKISEIFLHALESDPRQMNIQLGLCYAYAKAGMSHELIARLPDLKKYSPENENMANNMIQYADILARDFSYEKSLEVLKEVLKLYPDDYDVLSEIAVYYFYSGKIDESLKLFHKIEKEGNLSKSTVERMLLVYSLTEDYSSIGNVARYMAKTTSDGLIYQALEERLENNAKWYSTLGKYLRQNENEETDVEAFAEVLKKSAKINTLEKHIESTQYNLPAAMIAMNHAWGIKEYPKNFETLFNYADFLAYYKYYHKAVEVFKKIIDQNVIMTDEQREEFYFHYAWALHKAGQGLKAQQYWKPLLESQSFYKKSAASYFLGKYYFEKNDYKSARKYFSFVKDEAKKSKYAGFCRDMFEEISGSSEK